VEKRKKKTNYKRGNKKVFNPVFYLSNVDTLICHINVLPAGPIYRSCFYSMMISPFWDRFVKLLFRVHV